jgi:hypothetical protein
MNKLGLRLSLEAPNDGWGVTYMMDVQIGTAARRLNHVEFVHRPGEGGFVIDLFQALGCPSHQIDSPPYGKYVVVRMDDSPHGENDIFVTEVEPEQLALEDALQGQIDAGNSTLAAASARFRLLQKERPYRTTHVGIRVPSVAALDAVIERLGSLRAHKLAGRLDLGLTFTRSLDEAKRMSAPMKQIWVWTNVISTGLLAVGQQIELQAYGETEDR